MNTVIVPVDFSTTSLHTARYAAQLLVGHHGVNMLLYHGYTKMSEEEESMESLLKLKAELMADFVVSIEVLLYKSDDFVEGLERVARHRKADLVIMGITGKSAIAQVFFGSNTLKMVENKVCPLLIVPEKVAYRELKNVMLTSDFKDTVKTTPSAPIKDFLSVFNPKLHIVNVDKNHYISLTTAYEKEKQHLAEMFKDYDPEFYFMRLYDVNEALTLFAHDKDIDMIILIRRNENFAERIFRASRTKAMTYHSKVPILVMHE
ncbi:MAG: universal stress protein [Ferruginibacter sp.]|nr:universal stress protein [Ferruginibacter sp.]